MFFEFLFWLMEPPWDVLQNPGILQNGLKTTDVFIPVHVT